MAAVSRNLSIISTLFIAVIAILWTWRTDNSRESNPPPPVPGLNNTVLFLTSEASGLANVHLATSFTLLENHPSIQVHYASFPVFEKKVARTSAKALARNPAANPIKWHSLPGTEFIVAGFGRLGGCGNIPSPRGVAGIEKTAHDVATVLSCWPLEEHWMIYQALVSIIDDVDPSVVVIDHVFRPALDLVGNVDRRIITVSPNALLDLISTQQPWGRMFWKYPAPASGYPYPVPWNLIPANVYIHLRLALKILTTPAITAMKAHLQAKGVGEVPAFGYPEQIPVLAGTLPEANLPMEVIPPGLTFCGPIILDTATASEQDSELAAWMSNSASRTIIVNLGTLMQYNERQTRDMARTLAQVLAVAQDVLIAWKFNKDENRDFDESEALAPLRPYIEAGRIRIQDWFEMDTITMLQTGHVRLWVNHAGGNSFHEAIYVGIPQVVLPLWVDCYNYARLVEYLGIGIWPNQEESPHWVPEKVAKGILSTLEGDESVGIRKKAAELGEKARSYGGRQRAAREIASLAGLGI